MSSEVAVAVYRSVAEGVTNALRHGEARTVAVHVSTTGATSGPRDGRWPGVCARAGRRRGWADQLGGSLVMAAGAGRGIVLRVELMAVGEQPDMAPDVAVIDLDPPDGDGIELGAALKRTWPALRVVVLTMHADDRAVMRSLGCGLDGYLLKDSDPEDLLAAIHTAARRARSPTRCRFWGVGLFVGGGGVGSACSGPRGRMCRAGGNGRGQVLGRIELRCGVTGEACSHGAV